MFTHLKPRALRRSAAVALTSTAVLCTSLTAAHADTPISTQQPGCQVNNYDESVIFQYRLYTDTAGHRTVDIDYRAYVYAGTTTKNNIAIHDPSGTYHQDFSTDSATADTTWKHFTRYYRNSTRSTVTFKFIFDVPFANDPSCTTTLTI